jgi:hypothetical protein
MHKYRIGFLAGLGAGFVLGARAGREKYDQIAKTARAVADHPAVQQAAGVVQAQASSASGKLSDSVKERGSQLAGAAKDKVPGMRQKAQNGHSSNGRASTNSDRHSSARH